MNPIFEKQLAELERKLTLLLIEIRGQPVYERVEAWIDRMTGGKKLSDFMHHDETPIKNRVLVAKSLTDILLAKQYDRLPANETIKGAVITGLPDSDPPLFKPVAGAPKPKESKTLTDSPLPLTEEQIRKIVRHELAAVLQSISKVLRE